MIIWESISPTHVKYLDDAEYHRLKPDAQKNYRLYRCPLCTDATKAFEDVQFERRRQIAGEGFSYFHDDIQTEHELERAAAAYALNVAFFTEEAHKVWAWDPKWFKPKNERQDLVRAAALLIAAIERIDRQTAAVEQPQANGAGK